MNAPLGAGGKLQSAYVVFKRTFEMTAKINTVLLCIVIALQTYSLRHRSEVGALPVARYTRETVGL